MHWNFSNCHRFGNYFYLITGDCPLWPFNLLSFLGDNFFSFISILFSFIFQLKFELSLQGLHFPPKSLIQTNIHSSLQPKGCPSNTMVRSAKLRFFIKGVKEKENFFLIFVNKIFIASVVSLLRRDENSNQRLQWKCLWHGERSEASVKDSLWLYDNDNEDEDLAAKLRWKRPWRGERSEASVKATY